MPTAAAAAQVPSMRGMTGPALYWVHQGDKDGHIDQASQSQAHVEGDVGWPVQVAPVCCFLQDKAACDNWGQYGLDATSSTLCNCSAVLTQE